MNSDNEATAGGKWGWRIDGSEYDKLGPKELEMAQAEIWAAHLTWDREKGERPDPLFRSRPPSPLLEASYGTKAATAGTVDATGPGAHSCRRPEAVAANNPRSPYPPASLHSPDPPTAPLSPGPPLGPPTAPRFPDPPTSPREQRRMFLRSALGLRPRHALPVPKYCEDREEVDREMVVADRKEGAAQSRQAMHRRRLQRARPKAADARSASSAEEASDVDSDDARTPTAPSSGFIEHKCVTICPYRNPEDGTETCAAVVKPEDMARHAGSHLLDEYFKKLLEKVPDDKLVFAGMTGPFPTCPTCGRPFDRAWSLARHTASKPGQQGHSNVNCSTPLEDLNDRGQMLEKAHLLLKHAWVKAPYPTPTSALCRVWKKTASSKSKEIIIQILDDEGGDDDDEDGEVYDERYTITTNGQHELFVKWFTTGEPGGTPFYQAMPSPPQSKAEARRAARKVKREAEPDEKVEGPMKPERRATREVKRKAQSDDAVETTKEAGAEQEARPKKRRRI